MHGKTLSAGALLVMALAAVGCITTPAETAAAPTQEMAAEPSPQAVEPTPTGDSPTDAPVEPAATVVEPAGGESTAAHPDRPAAPAAVGADFRSDPPTVVAATGSPQLLEFFTWW
jgi:hypothetical protein